MAIGMRFRAGAMGVPFMPIRSMLGSDVLRQRPEAKEIRLPVHRREAAARAGAQPGRRADPCAALRRLRQRSDRRAAVHGHRSCDGGQPRDPHNRAHRRPTIRSAARPTRRRFPSSASTPWSRCPIGAAPHECYGVYEPMMRHMESLRGAGERRPSARHARLSRSLCLWVRSPGPISGADRHGGNCSRLPAAARSIYND